LLIQLELEANPTPNVSWYLDGKDLGEVDSRFVTKTEKKSSDSYLLSLNIKVFIFVIIYLNVFLKNIYLYFSKESKK
jgi:hypothetical protein